AILLVKGEFPSGFYGVRKNGNLLLRIRNTIDYTLDIGNGRFEPIIDLSVRTLDIGGILVLVFPVQNNLAAICIGINNFAPGTDSIIMLLGRIDLDLHRTGMVLTQEILYRIYVM